MQAERFDIVIVGARCAGSAAARLLAQSGLGVLVIDKATFPSETISTHGVGAVGIKLLEKWGLLDEVVASGVPWEDSVGVKFGDVEAEREIPPGWYAPMCPRRGVLDQILVRAARAAGAEVRERSIFREVIDQAGSVAGVRYSDDEGNTHEVCARLVIGADGASSRLARAVKAAQYNVRPSKVGFWFAYYSGIPIKRVELAWSHPRFAYVFPTNGDLACMAGAQADTVFDTYAAGDDQALLDLFEAASPRLAAVLRGGKRETRFFRFRGHPGRFRVPYGPGWALVGDAGFFRDPITGQGITDAFTGAQLLADAIIEGFTKPAGMQDALARYQRDRDDLVADGYAATQQLATLEWTNEELMELQKKYQPAPEKASALLALPSVASV
jgi:flavin-dependent dehydrogenase